MVEFNSIPPYVLVVEDDPHGLSFMESSLALSGFKVLSAGSVTAARKQCQDVGLENILAVLSDYRLPGESGIDLLRWIRQRDETLATLIITGQGEKSIVEESLRMGAIDYLEKPVTHQDLKKVMVDAVEHTRRSRQSVTDRRGLEELERFDQLISGTVPEGLEERIRFFCQPLHEVGGDFFITHTCSGREWLLLVGDVSGHDIKSAYVSTYFQGMFRGCVENGSGVQEFMDFFNRTLLKQGFAGSLETELVSLSLSVFYIQFESSTILHWNFGFSPSYVVTTAGRIEASAHGKFPLGWFENIDVSASQIPTRGNSQLLVFTDGLTDLAEELEVNPFSLLHRLLNDQNTIKSLPIGAKDDILTISYRINPKLPLNVQFQPILSEHYAGTEVDHIDHLQSNWRRSLNFALDDRLGDRLYDLLICIREGMLNALVHGCEKAPDKFAHLQICLSEDQSALRIIIDDPGRGHEFDLKERLGETKTQTGHHLGLGIIQHLSDDFRIDNKGTSLVFDFEINPVPV